MTAAARAALQSLSPLSLGWIKAHGTGTRVNDAAECLGLLALLGGDFSEVPLTSLKPALGHLLGACGAVETVAAIVALHERIVPPTLNTRQLDPALPRCTLALEPMTSRAPGCAAPRRELRRAVHGLDDQGSVTCEPVRRA